MLVSGRIKHQARVLRCPRREDNDARLLHLFFFFGVVIFDSGDLVPRIVGEHARDSRESAHLRAGFAGVGQIAHHRIGERADWTADVTPSIINAGRATLKIYRVHTDRRPHHADADGFQTLQPDLPIAESLHWRHRIGLALRPPNFFSLGVPSNPDVRRNLVEIRTTVGIIYP